MPYHVQIQEGAERALRRLPPKILSRFIGELRLIAYNPRRSEPGSPHSLWVRLGGLPVLQRLCIESWTVTYAVDEESQVIQVRSLTPIRSEPDAVQHV